LPDPLRIVIADDSYLVREGLRRLLEDSGKVEVLASVATADELLDAVGRLAPEAVITDIRMPPAHHVEGIEAALRIRDGYPDVGVVVLSQHSDEAYALKLFHAGTAGLAYLLKERVADLEGLLRALREVTVGGSVVDPLIVEALVSRRLRRRQSGLDELTPREFDVLREMAQGKSNAGMARALFLSESAIDKHVTSIFSKLGLGEEPELHKRVRAVLAFLRSGEP
jgi:DNA-binding NarL/FixJ family response regulator